jgi:hypothetical protein
MERIDGVVIAERGDQEYLINKGAEHGVVVGMRFAILGPDLPLGSERFPQRFEGAAAPIKQVAKAVRVEESQSTVKVFLSTRNVIERGLLYLSAPGVMSIVAPLSSKGLSPLSVAAVGAAASAAFAPVFSRLAFLMSAVVLYLRDRRNLVPQEGDRVVQIIGKEAQDTTEVPPA